VGISLATVMLSMVLEINRCASPKPKLDSPGCGVEICAVFNSAPV
jgi:hypothetical protein